MTLDTARPVQAHPISGTGPYGTQWPYRAGCLRVEILRADDTRLIPSADRYSIVPEEADVSGSVHLHPDLAAAEAGATLVLTRWTPGEQGWEAGSSARERGLEAQLDQMVMAQQELQAALAGGTGLPPGEGGGAGDGGGGLPTFANVAALLAEIAGYGDAANVAGRRVTAGPYSYQVAAADAMAHLVAASGLKLRLAPENANVVTLSSFGALDDGAAGIDNAPAFNRACEWLAGRGGGRLVVDAAGGGAGYHFNSTLRVPGGVHVVFETWMLWGARARMTVQGRLLEYPNGTGVDRPYYVLRQQCGAGTAAPDRLYLSLAANMQATDFAPGEMIVIRGENDSSGVAMAKEEAFVTEVNEAGNYLVLDRMLENTYEVSYPDSEQPEGTDYTTIARLLGSKLTVAGAAGNHSVTVADTAVFSVGDWVFLQDARTVRRFNSATGTIDTSGNLFARELSQITAIDAGSGTLTLTTPLSHDYLTSADAVAIRADPALGARIDRPRIRYVETPADLNRWAIWLYIAVASTVEDYQIVTVPGAAAGHATHAVRIDEGSMLCKVTGGTVSRVAASEGGYGYGVTLYKGARFNLVAGNSFDGCRHSVLEFMGAGHNIIAGNLSVNCLNSDFDSHNGNETGSLWIGNTARHGPDKAADVDVKAGFRLGNPAHIGGQAGYGSRNQILIGNVAEGFPQGHYAFDIQAPSGGHLLMANRATGRGTMVRIRYNARGDALANPVKAEMQALAIRDVAVIGNQYMDGSRLYEIDGGPGRAAERIVLRGNTSLRAAGDQTRVHLRRADRITLLDEADLHATAGAALDTINADDVTGLRILRPTILGAQVVARIANCPGAVIDGAVMAGVTSHVLVDGGGSPGLRLTDHRALDFTPTISTPGAASANRVIVRAAAELPMLTALSTLAPAANRLPYIDNAGAAALTTLTAFGRSLIDDADATAARTTLGLVPGVDVQPFHANLSALAALAGSAGKLGYFTGAGAMALADLTAFARTLLDDADAAAARTTLGLGTAATADRTATATDATAGRLLRVGDSATLLAAGSALRVAAGGTANAIALTSGAGIAGTPPAGLRLRFRAGAANTGATTIALDGGAAIACRTIAGVALPSGYVRTDLDTVATFDGTYWVLAREPERGSNANGSHVRLADGTQICRGLVTLAWSGVAGILTVIWTYPATFSTAPGTSFISRTSTGDYTNVNIRDLGARVAYPGTLTAVLNQYSAPGATGTWDATSQITNVAVTATGPWY